MHQSWIFFLAKDDKNLIIPGIFSRSLEVPSRLTEKSPMLRAHLPTIVTIVFCLLIICPSARAHMPHDRVDAIAVSPNYVNDQTVLCNLHFMGHSILRTTDCGEIWLPAQTGLRYPVSHIAFSPNFEKDGTVFVTTVETSIVSKTVDWAESWHECGTGLPEAEILCIAVSPEFATDRTLFVGLKKKGIYRSSDAGDTWDALDTGINNLTVYDLAVSPDFDTDQTLFIATNVGIYKSTDGGATWANPVQWGSTMKVHILAISPDFGQDQTLFASAWGQGLFKSTDGGSRWTDKTAGITQNKIAAVELSPNYRNDQTLLVATQKDGIFRSNAGGNNWALVNEGLDEQTGQATWYIGERHYFAFSFSPDFAQDGTVFLATFEGVHRSTNGGVTWRHMDIYRQNLVRGITISPDYANDGTVFAAAYGGGVYRTQDGGDSWEGKNTNIKYYYTRALDFSPDYAQDQTVFVGFLESIMKSTLQGESWFEVDSSAKNCRVVAVSPDYTADQTLFIGNDFSDKYALFKSVNGGTTFYSIDVNFTAVWCIKFSPDYVNDQTMFAGVSSKRVSRSTDRGENWDTVFQGSKINDIAVSPNFAQDRTVFGGTREMGVIKSTDGGDTWVQLNTGLPDDVSVRAMGISSGYQTDRTLLIGTKSRGVFKSTDGGNTWISVGGLEGTFIRCMVVSPAYPADQTAFLGTYDGVFRTTDGGDTWIRATDIRCYGDDYDHLVYRDGPVWERMSDSFTTGDGMSWSRDPQAKVEFVFTGRDVKWIGAKCRQCGIANVYLDGVFQTQVDLYSPGIKWQRVLFEKDGLEYDTHSLIIEVSGDKHPYATDSIVTIDEFMTWD